MNKKEIGYLLGVVLFIFMLVVCGGSDSLSIVDIDIMFVLDMDNI